MRAFWYASRKYLLYNQDRLSGIAAFLLNLLQVIFCK